MTLKSLKGLDLKDFPILFGNEDMVRPICEYIFKGNGAFVIFSQVCM